MSIDLSPEQVNWIEASEAGKIFSSSLVKDRPWSTVFRLECERGTAFFKVCGSGCKHEAELLQWLEPKFANYLPELLNVDTSESWILLRDAGQPTGHFESTYKRLHYFQTLLPNYATLLIRSLAQTDALLSLGIPDRRLSHAPKLFEALLEKPFIDLSLETRYAITKNLHLFKETCLELTSSSFASALDHGDLHIWNVLVKNDKPVIIDWGDATLTHPFIGIYQTLSLLFENRFSFSNPQVQNLKRCYLEPWTIFAPFRELERHLKLALSIAPIMQSIHLANISELSGETDSDWISSIEKSLNLWLELQENPL